MGLPLAIAEGILIALGILATAYFGVQLLWIIGQLAVGFTKTLMHTRRPYGPTIPNYRWYRTSEGKRKLWQEMRVLFYMIAGMVVFMAACLLWALLSAKRG